MSATNKKQTAVAKSVSPAVRKPAKGTAAAKQPVRAPASRVKHAVSEVVPPAATVEAPNDDTLAALAKAIGHPVRVSILRLLATRDTCVTVDLVNTIGLAQSTVSEHLRLLREAGLIQGEIEGPRTRYCVDQTGLLALKAGIATL